MNCFTSILLLLAFPISAQEAQATFVQTKVAYFQKESWFPFTGTVKSQDEQFLVICEIENGFPKYTENFDLNGKLLYSLFDEEFIQRMDTVNKTPKLRQSSAKDISEIKYAEVMITFDETGEKRKRSNGFIQWERQKLYFENGVRVRVEAFYDADCKRIRERIALFHTAVGNPIFDLEESYDGAYTLFDEKGKVLKTGTYKLGQLTLD
ncbi:MAG: hypothetical protein EOO50_02720 [Flavobacterium sp.]|uniref:hypothetical protein n=1 Tax=Flavobacterium sp. TaxID=239 RepID=UPI00120DF027|nr:hypothetical protein [Flavobacterium sp.]RZJ68352.1 MAG: hypothetical protein EOO50_02720 [Flavobacterium sp.]